MLYKELFKRHCDSQIEFLYLGMAYNDKIDWELIEIGDERHVPIIPIDFFERVSEILQAKHVPKNAKLYVSHNHPNKEQGVPSSNDYLFTHSVNRLLNSIGRTIEDHYIICQENKFCFSFKDFDLMDDFLFSSNMTPEQYLIFNREYCLHMLNYLKPWSDGKEYDILTNNEQFYNEQLYIMRTQDNTTASSHWWL